tara:strand:+ start:422 stop:688 length:267 start_codon:yes stop_codon:yes gene_type:complete
MPRASFFIRLIPHDRKSGIDLPRFHANDIKPCIRQTAGQVLCERTSFEPHLMDRLAEPIEAAYDVRHVRRDRELEPDFPVFVDNADCH